MQNKMFVIVVWIIGTFLAEKGEVCSVPLTVARPAGPAPAHPGSAAGGTSASPSPAPALALGYF